MNPETFNDYAAIFFLLMMCGGFLPFMIIWWSIQGWLERIREFDFKLRAARVEDLPKKGDYVTFPGGNTSKVIKIYKKTRHFKLRPIK